MQAQSNVQNLIGRLGRKQMSSLANALGGPRSPLISPRFSPSNVAVKVTLGNEMRDLQRTVEILLEKFNPVNIPQDKNRQEMSLLFVRTLGLLDSHVANINNTTATSRDFSTLDHLKDLYDNCLKVFSNSINQELKDEFESNFKSLFVKLTSDDSASRLQRAVGIRDFRNQFLQVVLKQSE